MTRLPVRTLLCVAVTSLAACATSPQTGIIAGRAFSKGPAWGAGADPWLAEGGMVAFVQSYSGQVVATLFGDRGDSMRCRFQVSDPDAGLSGGGGGQCQTSNGWTIDAQI